MGSPVAISLPDGGKSWIGRGADFVLQTVVVYYCAMRLSQWLVFHWFAWVAPLLQISISIPATDWYLQHFESATILPALIAGYCLNRFLPDNTRIFLREGQYHSMARWAWVIPTGALLVKMLLYQASSSVLVQGPATTIRYFFDIQKVMPTFANPLASDPVRIWAQMSITAPFYAGIAYTVGAIAAKQPQVKRSKLETRDQQTPVVKP